jgi:predicted ATP-dependent protease
MAQGRVVLLVTCHGEVSEAAQKASALEGEIIAMRRAQDVAEEKILSLAAKTVVAKW